MNPTRNTPTKLTLLSLACGLIACGPPPRPHTDTHVRTTAVRIRSVTFVVPPIAAPRLLAHATNAASYYAVGGLRVRYRDNDAEAANQSFASAIVGGGAIGARWWFVSAHGSVASASDFLDNVQFERDLGGPVARAFVHDGALIAALADGRVLRVDVAPVAMPASLLEGADAAPLPAPEQETSVVADAALRRIPMARMVLPSSALLTSGDVVVRAGASLHFASMSSDGSLQPTAHVSLGAEASGDCDMHAWGARALLTCPATARDDETTPITPFVVDHDGADRAGPTARSPLIVGREGHTLTYPHPCPERPASGASAGEAPSPPAADTSALLVGCTLDRDRDWREWQYPRQGRLLDVFDSTALVVETRDGAPLLRYYDIDMGRGMDVRLNDPAAEVARAGFAPDGRIVVMATAGTSRARRSLVGIGAPGSTIDLRPVGFFARDLDLADARMGLVVGENAADVAETRDGGLTWLHVDGVAIDGEARSFPLFAGAPAPTRPERIGTDVHCTPTICRAGTHLVHTWDRTVEIVPPMP